MKEERMMILKMVQEGKITADEAVKLFNAVAQSSEKSDTIKQVRDKAMDIVDEAKPVVKKYAGKAGKVLNDVVDAFKDGIDNFNSKPRKSDFTDDVIDEVSDSFDDLQDDYEVFEDDENSEDSETAIEIKNAQSQEKVQKITNSVKENTEAAKDTVKEAARNIKETAQETAESIKKSANDIKETAGIAAMDLKDKAENIKEDIKDEINN